MLLLGVFGDEPMAHRVIKTTYSENKHDFTHIAEHDVSKYSNIQFGSLTNIMNNEEQSEDLLANYSMPCNVFIGTNLKVEEKKGETKEYVMIGSMVVPLAKSKEHILVLQAFPKVCNTLLS